MPSNSKEFKSALKVNKGISQPPIINNESVINYKLKRRKKLSVEEYIEGILTQNRTILSQAITLIESSLPKHFEIAQQIIEKCLPHTGNSIRIGITGVPGVGKSTFIEVLGNLATFQGHKLAVLAIDPSSERSGGSILGDKTRMEQLANHPDAFIRPSPTAGSLGGVARKTRETIYLCEAAGFDVIFIETVGVGQSEIAVHSMVDFFLLLMLAGAGDELQGIKRGIMEMADAIAITKSDGNNVDKANRAKAEYQNALHLFPPSESGWIPKVLSCSAQYNQGIDVIWDSISEFINTTKNNGHFQTHRIEQAKYWMHQAIRENLSDNFYKNHSIKIKLSSIEKDVLEGKISSFEAARNLLSYYFEKIKS
jgi:LAO/AO transport system kinase